MAFPCIETYQTRPMDDSGVARHAGAAAQPAGRCGNHISPAIGDAHGSCASRRWRRRPWSLEWAHAIGVAGANLKGRCAHVDQRPTDSRVLVRQERLHRHANKVWIAIILVTIREAEFHRFGNHVYVIRREKSHPLYVESL